jgi:hypothetical protein
MGLHKLFASRIAALFFGLLLGGLPTYAATAAGGYGGHDVVAGDFNGDGWMDFILQAVSGHSENAEFLADKNGNYDKPVAVWKGQHNGLDWNANSHKILSADFNGDGRDDVFLQGEAGLGSAVLLADPDGKFTRIAEVPPRTIGGLDFSQSAHHLIADDFNGDGRADLLLQANGVAGDNGVALSEPDGSFRALVSSWKDGDLGLHWSVDHVTMSAGDFDGDGRAEALLRSKIATQKGVVCCHIVGFDREQQPGKIVQSWKTGYLGLDWSPADYKLLVADLNGDGRADLLLQPRTPGNDMYVLLSNRQGQFDQVSAHWPAEHDGVDWSVESYHIVAKNAAEEQPARLLFIPEQRGLPYERISLDKTGAVTKVKTLASLPPTLASAGAADGGGMTPRAATGGSARPHAAGGHAAGDAVGTISGKFSVGDSGSADYRIPIAVAPGVNDLKPDLSIVYSSRQGGSQLGLGWALSGLSAITRCPATVATDGYAKAPNFAGGNKGDRFCLDNSHLYANGSQEYGASGTNYHTNPASFKRIVSHGAQGNGPASFEVWDKSGTIRYYGETTDSSISAGSTFDNTTAVWLLDKITDRYGNFIRFTYAKDKDMYSGVDQSYKLSKVEYGNNQGKVVGKLVFDYALSAPTAFHSQLHFASGVAHILNYEMTAIKVYSAGSHLWTYKMSYDLPTSTRPMLTSVTQCDALDNCYPATKFTYASPVSGYVSSKIGLVAGSNISHMHFGDVDGDGKTDLIYVDSHHSNHWCIYLTGSYQTACTSIPKGVNPKHAVVIDANSDGRADLLVPEQNGKWKLYESTGSTIASSVAQTLSYYNGDHPIIVPADVTGDGYPELFFHHDGKLWYYPNNDGTFGTAKSTGYVIKGEQDIQPFRFTNSTALSIYIGHNQCDMNGGGGDGDGGGDGGPPGRGVPPTQPKVTQPKAAVQAVPNATGSTTCQASVGALVYNHESGAFDHYDAPWRGHVKFFDINGDGLDDILRYAGESEGYYTSLYLNHGGV